MAAIAEVQVLKRGILLNGDPVLGGHTARTDNYLELTKKYRTRPSLHLTVEPNPVNENTLRIRTADQVDHKTRTSPFSPQRTRNITTSTEPQMVIVGDPGDTERKFGNGFYPALSVKFLGAKDRTDFEPFFDIHPTLQPTEGKLTNVRGELLYVSAPVPANIRDLNGKAGIEVTTAPFRGDVTTGTYLTVIENKPQVVLFLATRSEADKLVRLKRTSVDLVTVNPEILSEQARILAEMSVIAETATIKTSTENITAYASDLDLLAGQVTHPDVTSRHRGILSLPYTATTIEELMPESRVAEEQTRISQRIQQFVGR